MWTKGSKLRRPKEVKMEKKEDGRCTRDGNHSRGTRHVRDFHKEETRKQPAEVNTR